MIRSAVTFPNGAKPAQSVEVIQGMDFAVVNGANLGDALSFADELDLDDVYELHHRAHNHRLSLIMEGASRFSVAPDSPLGRPGATVHLDCAVTLMAASGMTAQMLVLVETDAAGHVADIYGLPLARLAPRTGYALVGIDRADAAQTFAQLACVSFTRGTCITLASGAQCPIEALTPGDRVLTRDDGPQPVRWVGQTTTRAVGAFAPVLIRAGALNNDSDLRVSPDHRLFVYQRSDALGAGRSEVLVRARHLVNGASVVQEPGGFVDYFQLLFDAHQIIYAEGIAAETLLLDPRSRAALPGDLPGDLTLDAARRPGHAAPAHQEFEVAETLLDRPDAAGLLRRASTG